MLTLIAILAFVLAAFGVDLGEVDLLATGLAFFAAGHLFDGALPAFGRRA